MREEKLRSVIRRVLIEHYEDKFDDNLQRPDHYKAHDDLANWVWSLAEKSAQEIQGEISHLGGGYDLSDINEENIDVIKNVLRALGNVISRG